MAPDSILVDTTNKSIDIVVSEILKYYKKCINLKLNIDQPNRIFGNY